MTLIEQGALTDEEKVKAENLFGPANIRAVLARAEEMLDNGQPGRLGIFAHMNGRGEVTENEIVLPPIRRRRRSA